MSTPFEHLDMANDMQRAAELMQNRLTNATIGRYGLGQDIGDIDYIVASVGVVAVMPDSMTADEAVMLADREMYKVKQQRKHQKL